METAQIAEPLSGDKLYQQRARKALPLLVRQAIAAKPISYENLAFELGMPNPRNLNYVLGSIGQTLNNLSEHWGVEVPPIQCLVVSKKSGLPGEGIAWFITDLAHYKKLSSKQRRQVVDLELQKIYAFEKWRQVLRELKLKPVPKGLTRLNKIASKNYGGGEGKEHKKLKNFIATIAVVLLYFSGCSTIGQISSNAGKGNGPSNASELIKWSQEKTFKEIIESAGQPGAVDIKNDSMVIQYCSTGLFTDKYVQLFLYKKRVVGSYQTNAYIAEGFCSQVFPSPQWLNAPQVILDDLGLSFK